MKSYEIVQDKLSKLENDAKMNNVPILRPQTAKLLGKIVRETKPEKILEIGTAIGYSGIIMLSESEKSFLTTLEKEEDSAKKAQKNFEELELENRVKIVLGDAMDSIQNLTDEFDFIFLDGPKGQYIKYLPYLKQRLKVGGILFSDNVLYRGMVNGKTEISKKKRTLVRNLQLFLKTLDEDEEMENRTLEIEDGVSVAKKIR